MKQWNLIHHLMDFIYFVLTLLTSGGQIVIIFSGEKLLPWRTISFSERCSWETYITDPHLGSTHLMTETHTCKLWKREPRHCWGHLVVPVVFNHQSFSWMDSRWVSFKCLLPFLSTISTWQIIFCFLSSQFCDWYRSSCRLFCLMFGQRYEIFLMLYERSLILVTVPHLFVPEIPIKYC